MDDKEVIVSEYFIEVWKEIKEGCKLFFEYPIYKLMKVKK